MQSPYVLCRLFKKHDGKDENGESLDCADVDQSSSPQSVVKSSTEDVQSEPVTPYLTGQPNVEPLTNGILKVEDFENKNENYPLEFLDCQVTDHDVNPSDYQMVCAFGIIFFFGEITKMSLFAKKREFWQSLT